VSVSAVGVPSGREPVKKLVVIACSAVAAVATSLVLIAEAGAAPDQTGETFAQAKAALTQAGYDPVVFSAVGGSVPRDDCTVVRQQTTTATPFLGGAGPRGGMIQGNGNPRVLLSLDCSSKPK